MNGRAKEAGRLQSGDLIQVEHHEHDGPPCCGGWCVEVAVVDNVDKARVLLDEWAVVEWHDADHPTCCGVISVKASTRIPYLGQAAA